MAEDRKKKIQPADMVKIDSLLEHLAAKDIITCEERDRIIQRIAKDNKVLNFCAYRTSQMISRLD